MEGRFTPETTLCISVAERPSKFGYTLFNTAFQATGIPMAYKPITVTSEEQLERVVQGIRGLGIRGCGVSMPHKTTIMRFLDEIDAKAEKIGAVNTVVNDGGILRGYNTDYVGAKRVFENAGVRQGTTALLLGAGGVARALLVALLEIGASVVCAARDETKAKQFSTEFGISVIPWEQRETHRAELLVNATPVGMEPHPDDTVVNEAAFDNFAIVMDVVAKPPKTALITIAEKRGKKTLPGYDLVLHQALRQYELYTGKEAPVEVMRKALYDLIGLENS